MSSTSNEKFQTNPLTTSPPPAAVSHSSHRPDGTIVIPSTLPTISDVDSAKTLTPVESSRTSFSGTTTPRDPSKDPCSAFYSHPTSRYSLEVQKSETKNGFIAVADIDLEACRGKRASDESQRRKDCSIWPGKHTLRDNSRKQRCKRGKKGIKGWLAGLDKRTLLCLKILLAVLLIGGIVGLAVGVSKTVGGGVWKSDHQSNAKIGHGN